MAIRHNDLPKRIHGHISEHDLAVHLSALDDPHLHLWFGLDDLPGVPDIDILLYHENVGAFVIEVKAVRLQDIERFESRLCKIYGRDLQEGPQYQASNARTCLLNFLRPQLHRKIFLSSTACWPRIERREWRETWNNPMVGDFLADRMLFYEDLFVDSQTLVERLRFIQANPPVKAPPKFPIWHSQEILEDLIHTLRISAERKPTPTDLDRLKAIEDDVKKKIAKEAPTDRPIRLLYKGGPGTGKTFRLLQIAYNHALAGRRVLYCCFNKVLAADIRRLLSFSRSLKLSGGSIDIFDVYEMLSHHVAAEDLAAHDETYDDWAKKIVAGLSKQPDQLAKYDTLLIDEAQDLKDWAFTLFELRSRANSTIAVALGSGQELYASNSSWLTTFTKNAETKALNRNFRNTEAVFKLSQLFFEAFGATASKFEKTLQRFKDRKPDQKQLALPMIARLGGSLPALLSVDTRHSSMVEEYTQIIGNELRNLTEQQRPIDVLLLVPSEQSDQRRWVVEALATLEQKFVDYTVHRNRRFVAQPESVRLCTFHSSRGIEGHRVIIFGFEELMSLAPTVSTSVNNLGYIVLSRATFDLSVLHRSTVKSSTIEFIRRSLVAISKAEPAKLSASRAVQMSVPAPVVTDGQSCELESLLSLAKQAGIVKWIHRWR